MENFLPLINYILVMGISPGPNSLILLISSACFGLKKTLPIILGFQLGITLLIIISGFCLNIVIHHMGDLTLLFELVGTGYMLYVLWALKGDIFGNNLSSSHQAKPFPWLAVTFFQFINPRVC